MDDSQKLHTYARRVCIERHQRWVDAYSTLATGGADRVGPGYTDQAYGIFPRYNVDSAVLADVCRLDFGKLPEFEELRAHLALVAETAPSLFAQTVGIASHDQAMWNERRALAEAFRNATRESVVDVEPLPYQRTLHGEEAALWLDRIQSAWGGDGWSLWPLADRGSATLSAFRVSEFDAALLEQEIRRFLAARGVSRVIEILEDEWSYETDADSVVMSYGPEGHWIDTSLTWVVYCSHEETITFGGAIIDAISEAFPLARPISDEF